MATARCRFARGSGVAPVLLIGLDPRKIAGFDPAPVELAIAMGHKQFVDAGILVELFEDVIDLIRHHAPQAAIAFNTNPMTSVDAAKRRMP
jgi:hypothetical protein